MRAIPWLRSRLRHCARAFAAALTMLCAIGVAQAATPPSDSLPATPPPVTGVVYVPVHQGDDSVYRAFGERAGIAAIIDTFYDELLVDPRTKTYFDGAPIKRIKVLLTDQICNLLNGPCEYTGRDMRRAHAGLNIDRAAFDALVEDLQDAMDKHHIPFHTQNKLLAKLAPMYRQIQDRE